MNRKIIIASLFLAIMASGSLFAQNNEGDLEDIEVVIRKDKDIELPRANRNYQKVSKIPDPEIKASQPVEFGDYRIRLSPMDPSIRINKLKSEALDKLYGNYVRAGFGNYTNTYLEGFFGNKRNDKGFYNLYLGHDAYAGGPVDNSGTSTNRIGVNGGLFFDDITLESGLSYDRRFYNFYGYPNDSIRSFAEDVQNVESEQVFNQVGVSLALSKKDPVDYLNFDLGLNFDHLSDNLNQSENWLSTNFNAKYDLNVDQDIIMDARYILGNYNLDSFSISRHLFEIAPQYQFTSGNFLVRAGLRVSYESDTNLQGDLHIYPLGLLEYSAFDGKFRPYVGISGSLEDRGLISFTRTNPWLGAGNVLSHSNREIDVFAGFKTSFIKNTSLGGKVSYATVDNLPVFINDPTELSKFRILYGRNASVLNLHLESSTKISSSFDLGLSFDLWDYGFSDSTRAWHLPGIESHVFGKFNVGKKIYMNVDIFFINGIFAYTSMDQEMALDDILDLNFQAEYKFSERFSAFMEFKNILSTQYQRYLYYDNRGIQVRAGLTYSF